MRKRFVMLSLLFFACKTAYTQYPHFSQFFASPLTLNPANTGNFIGSFRATSNIRNQWPSINNAYTTYTVSLDAPILEKKLPKFDKLGIGFVAMSDQTGNKLLSENALAFSVAYKKNLDGQGNSSITGGLQTSYVNYRFNPSHAYFEDQLTVDGFVSPSSEQLLGKNLSKSFIDFHAGLIYSLSTTDLNMFYIGTSYFHSFSPALNFNDQQNNISPRINIHGGGYWPLSYHSTFHTSIQYQQKKNQSELIFGGIYSYFLQPNEKTAIELYFGSWIRLNDSVIPYFGFEYNSLMLGLSYDININQKTGSQYYRSGEVSLKYKFNPNSNGIPIKCPIF